MEKTGEYIQLDLMTYNRLLRSEWEHLQHSRKSEYDKEALTAEVNKIKVEVNKRAVAIVAEFLSKLEKGVEVKVDIDFTKILKGLYMEGTALVRVLKAKYDD